jgi:trans-aconitate methyltransferase
VKLEDKKELFQPGELSKDFYSASPGEFEMFCRFFRKNHLPFLPQDKDARVLDIGCGPGHFLRFLQREGYMRSEGVELSQRDSEFCQQNGLKVTTTDVTSFLEQADEPYDCIVMNEVLEHFAKDEMLALLGLIKSNLADGGVLIVKVPNMANFITGSRQRYNDFSHEVGFVPQALLDALRLGGLADATVYPVNIYVHRIVPLNWAAGLAAWALHKMMWLLFALHGMPTKCIFTKGIMAVARKGQK